MISDVVLTQADLTTRLVKKDTIGLGSYGFDSHPDSLVAGPDGTLYHEGLISAPITGRYDIPYSILVPKWSEMRNLLDPVTVSASHVAFASLRMEPQYMMMGQAAGSAAALAIRSGVDVQRVDIAALHAVLRANGVVFRPPPAARGASLAPSVPSTAGPTIQSPAAASSVPLPAISGPTDKIGGAGSVRQAVALEGGLVVTLVVALTMVARARRRRPPSA